MVAPDMPQLDATFAALSDGTRRAIVARLAEGETSLSDLAEPFDMSLTAVSKHLRVLSDAGLVDIEKRGRTRHCRLRGAPIKEAVDWLSKYEAFWIDRFDALARHLAKESEK
ncbi:metalloregulator ArsR/SmtB family transcription factor [Roseibium sp. LAB1]